MTSVEPLLFRSEGDTLDFKSENYRFYGASDADKAELLKDIVAMANAWKNGDAHIVIGIGEQNGRAADILGVEANLFDNDVQQFVNTKTNRPVIFSVEHVPYHDKTLTIIRIDASQTRPVFLRKAFGGLRGNVVFVRRGSSTVEADPDEIKEMGRTAAMAAAPPRPDVRIEFEAVLDTQSSQNFLWFDEGAPEIEVRLLRVTIKNCGSALARFIQGHVVIPSSLLDPRLWSGAITRSFSNKMAGIAVDYDPIAAGDWRPLSPGMRLQVHEEQLRTDAVSDDDASIGWELAVDDCALSTGRCLWRDIPVVDSRGNS